MRLAYYAGASTAAAAACLLKAFHQRPNFYSATVYLSQSNACLLILTNLLLVGACTFIYALQRLLYGPLRPIEIEQLSEKAWYAVLDTLLAMPSFREDVGGWLLAMFTLLLAGKVWGWIGEGRVDVLEQGQPAANQKLFHARLATSLVLSVIFDIWMLDYCIETVLADPRPGMMVIFTFEFAVLCVFSVFTLARYGLSIIQMRIEKQQLDKAIDERKDEIRAERAAARQNETADGAPTPASPPNEDPIDVDENEVSVPGWEEKRRYLFALEVFTDFIKLMIYIVFFTVSITFNGLPMHIMRDVYMTFASFSKRVADYVAYKKATSDMNTRYPDATTEEIRGDACIVCRESMVAWEQPANVRQGQEGQQQQNPTPASQRRDEGLRAKKLPCGHILHLRCLKAWLERQQVCPTCRRPVIVPTTTTAGAGAQGVAANQQAPGQGGQQQLRQPPAQGQGQGRARVFNFGPIRIGFLNGPGDQIGNIVRQMQNQGQNQNQQNAQQQADQDANQQGPNHLGLQVPYASTAANNGQQQQNNRAQVPTHIQFQQLEQRLVQEAQNLGLEQQQLVTLRAMEGEVQRLRAMQQQGGASGQQRLPQIGQLPMMPLAPFGPWQQYPVMMPPPPPPPPETLQGGAGEQMGRGDPSLPEGLVLPEGWTVMPLRRAAGSDAHLAEAQVDGQVAERQATESGSSREAQRQASAQGTGPTDERGSPLFVPTNPSTNTSASVPPTSLPPSATQTNPQSTTNGETSSSSTARTQETSSIPSAPPSNQNSSRSHSDQSDPNNTRNPWNPEAGWSFVDPPTNGHTTASQEDTENTAPNFDTHTNGTPREKGKAKAARVEDVPDEEASR